MYMLHLQVPAPMCLFFLDDKKELVPVAIQLYQKPSEDNPVSYNYPP